MIKKIVTILIMAIVIVLSACSDNEIVSELDVNAVVEQEDNSLQDVEEDTKPLEELQLNRTILENIGRPFSEILKDEPNLIPRDFYVIDAAAMCFTDPEKTYSYILFVTQYLPYDEYAAEAIEKKDIRCAGIYTTVKEMFPDFTHSEDPQIFFNRIGVDDLNTNDSENLRDRGVAYYTYFRYEQMLFQVFGGTADSPTVMSAEDIVTVEIPTENENLINEYYNDITYPDGIGCVSAIGRAREYRISLGRPDCSFSIMRDGIVDTVPGMGLADKQAYAVSPNLDQETYEAERCPVYYVGYISGKVFERSLYDQIE